MAKKRKQKKKFGWKGQIFLIVAVLSSAMFSAVALILAVGMIPTIVAAVVDRTKGHVRSMTVGAINFAGCAPFIVEVFKKGNDLALAVNYIIQPRTLVVMWMAAAMGYMIDWAMTGIVSSIMVQRAKNQMKNIEKDQKSLVSRWGVEVTGTIPLDEYGFPKEMASPKEQQ